MPTTTTKFHCNPPHVASTVLVLWYSTCSCQVAAVCYPWPCFRWHQQGHHCCASELSGHQTTNEMANVLSYYALRCGHSSMGWRAFLPRHGRCRRLLAPAIDDTLCVCAHEPGTCWPDTWCTQRISHRVKIGTPIACGYNCALRQTNIGSEIRMISQM